jgi:transposase
VFYYADELNLSWFPTLRAMWSPKGQPVMIPTPGQPDKYYGIGAVNYHTGENVVLFQRRKRRQEIAQLLEALVEKHSTGTIYVLWDNASMHEDDEIQAVVRAAAGRLVLLYLPTYSPWLNPIEMLWRQVRREVTHGELFETKPALLSAAQQGFDRFNQCPEQILSVIGSNAQKVS